ncbi:DUF222 domain-containing protein [Pengzhenrongella phosphoraccumulans]|uniref:DUF222 domain-containing protein n=1 Tax=Pengzhenrongella phosphoraccumulans TaxID=3114394 RepID=UPI0038908716
MFESGVDAAGAGTPAPPRGPVAEPEPPSRSVALAGVGSSVDVVFAAMVAELLVRPSATADPGASWPAAQRSLRLPPASGAGDWAPSGIARSLDAAAPGLRLVALLDDLEPAQVSDAALIELVAGWERTGSWVAARQADAIAELARRRSTGRTIEFTGDEIAARLAMTRSVAEGKVVLAQGLELAPEVRAALTAGVIDTRKALVLTEDTAHLGIDDARALQVAVLPAAPDLTPPALRARLRRAELTMNPAAGAERRTRAAARRRVSLTPAADAMAWLTAYLPAADATTIYEALTALATTTEPRPTPGTGTTSCADSPGAPGDDRGIDARRADALTDLFRNVLDTGLTPTGTPLSTTHGRRPHLQVTAAATTLLGLDELPGELAGYGPIPADLVREIAADATWRRLFTDPATGNTLAAGSCTYRPGADLTRTVIARDATCTFPGCRTRAWRCDLDHLDPYDHTRSSDDGGGGGGGEPQTRCENLHSLCRHHHRLKTHTGWKVTRTPGSGDTHWTAPTGHRYTRPSSPAAPHDPPTPHPRPGASPPVDLGPPPF